MAAPMLYLGTTSADLYLVRQQVTTLLEAAGYVLCDAASTGASPHESFESHVRGRLSQCTGMVLLVGTSHGPPPSPQVQGEPVSCTQVEYRLARDLGTPCHAFVLHEDFPADVSVAIAHPETPAQQAAQFHFRHQLQAQTRGWELIGSPERLGARLRLLAYRLEEVREDAAAAGSPAPVAPAPARTPPPPQIAASPPVTRHDPVEETSGEPRTRTTTHIPPQQPAPVQKRGHSVVIFSAVGVACLLAAAGVLGWSQIQRNRATAMPAPNPVNVAVAHSSTPASEPGPTLTASSPPAPEQTLPAPNPVMPTAPLPPTGAPLVPIPSTPVKAVSETPTAESRAEFVVTRRLLMNLADLHASLFFPQEPLTLQERRQVAMQHLARHEHMTVEELERRFSAFASGSASAPLDRALAAYVKQDYRSAAAAAAEAVGEQPEEPDELRAALLLQAHTLFFNQDSKGAIAIYARVMKDTDGIREPKEWTLSTSMVAMLNTSTKSGYKPVELMMKVLEMEEYNHGKESYAVARTLRQMAQHLPTRDDLNELRETALGRASKIHEKLDPERSTPEVARIYIAFAKGRSSRPANESSKSDAEAGTGSIKPRKTGFRNDAYYAGAIKIDERHFGPDSPTVADDLMEQGQDFTTARRFAEAEPPLRRALAILNKQKGPKHQDTITAQISLARLLRETDRLDEAEAVQLSALANQKECPDGSAFCLGLRHYELSKIYKAAGRAQEYEKTLRAGVAAGKDDDWAEVFPLHMMLEELVEHLEAGRRDLEAVPFIIRRVDVMEKHNQISPDESALWLGKAANTLSNASDDNSDADLLFKRALKAGAGLPPATAAIHVVNLRRYADYLIPLKRIEEAEKYLREAVKLDEQVPLHEETGTAALLLGSVLMSHGDPKEAITHLKAALPMIIPRHGELHPDVLWGYYCLSTSYLMADRPKEAEPLLRKTIALMDKAAEKDPVVYASTVLAHGMSLMDLNRLDDAEAVLRRSVQLEYAAQQEEGDSSGSETAANYYRDVITIIYGLTEEEAEERISDVKAGKSVPKLEIRKPAKVPRPKLTA